VGDSTGDILLSLQESHVVLEAIQWLVFSGSDQNGRKWSKLNNFKIKSAILIIKAQIKIMKYLTHISLSQFRVKTFHFWFFIPIQKGQKLSTISHQWRLKSKKRRTTLVGSCTSTST
jgi:hypothetical protein